MDIIKAVCQCKDFSEEELVVGIREKLLENWSGWNWFFAILLVIISAGAILPFMLGWIVGGYYAFPVYRCQFCNRKIEKKDYR